MKFWFVLVILFSGLHAWGQQRNVVVRQEAPSQMHLDSVSQDAQVHFEVCDEFHCLAVTTPLAEAEFQHFLVFYRSQLTEIEIQRVYPNRAWEHTLNNTSLLEEVAKYYLTGAATYIVGSLVENRFQYPYVAKFASGRTFLASVAAMFAWGYVQNIRAQKVGYLANDAQVSLYLNGSKTPMFLSKDAFAFLTRTLQIANKVYLTQTKP